MNSTGSPQAIRGELSVRVGELMDGQVVRWMEQIPR